MDFGLPHLSSKITATAEASASRLDRLLASMPSVLERAKLRCPEAMKTTCGVRGRGAMGDFNFTHKNGGVLWETMG